MKSVAGWPSVLLSFSTCFCLFLSFSISCCSISISLPSFSFSFSLSDSFSFFLSCSVIFYFFLHILILLLSIYVFIPFIPPYFSLDIFGGAPLSQEMFSFNFCTCCTQYWGLPNSCGAYPPVSFCVTGPK